MSPIIELLKEPVPKPSLVLVLKVIVGLGEVLQTIPLADIVDPPSLVTVPPLRAVVVVILAAVVVVTDGSSALVVSVSSFVYRVDFPAEL